MLRCWGNSFRVQDMLAIPECEFDLSTSTTSASQRKNTSNCSARFRFYKTKLIYECDGECDDERSASERSSGGARWYLEPSKSSNPMGRSGVVWSVGLFDRRSRFGGAFRLFLKPSKWPHTYLSGSPAHRSREHIVIHLLIDQSIRISVLTAWVNYIEFPPMAKGIRLGFWHTPTISIWLTVVWIFMPLSLDNCISITISLIKSYFNRHPHYEMDYGLEMLFNCNICLVLTEKVPL